MNATCTFVYFFVAPVIAAIIHRYVNYFDIQVLMMVTETKTLTLTLHYNIFTYLDCFFCYLYMLCKKSTKLNTLVKKLSYLPF